MSNKHFQVKGSQFTLTVLELYTPDLKAFEAQLKEKVQLAPKFFRFAPVVVDVKHLPLEQEIDFHALKNLLCQIELIPVAIRGAHLAWQPRIEAAQMAIMQSSGDGKESAINLKDAEKNAMQQKSCQEIRSQGSLLVTQPVRSGQQIYAQGGDLVVISSVSPGSELLADGNIHVYGTLRGRALAGVGGNDQSRIFCNSLEAELVAIAGQYKIFDDIASPEQGKAKQLYLKDGSLMISTLM